MINAAIDPTFYRTAAEAAAAARETHAYVVAFDRAGARPDALTVVDVDESSPTYGQLVGWTNVVVTAPALPVTCDCLYFLPGLRPLMRDGLGLCMTASAAARRGLACK